MMAQRTNYTAHAEHPLHGRCEACAWAYGCGTSSYLSHPFAGVRILDRLVDQTRPVTCEKRQQVSEGGKETGK